MAPKKTDFQNEVENKESDTKKECTQQDSFFDWEAPPKQGLYDPNNEHEACGVGFIVAIDGKRNHKVSWSV